MFSYADVVYLCASVAVPNAAVLHDLQFVNAGRGCKRHTPEPVS